MSFHAFSAVVVIPLGGVLVSGVESWTHGFLFVVVLDFYFFFNERFGGDKLFKRAEDKISSVLYFP